MKVLKCKVITIAAFWLLTGLMVLSIPLNDTALEKPLSSQSTSEQKIALMESEKI